MSLPRPTRSDPSWVPYAGLLLAIGGIVYQAGAIGQRIDGLTDKVAALEADSRTRGEQDLKRDMRGARIEAKLDLISTPHKQQREEQP